VPWQPEKPAVSRFRSKSVPVRKPEVASEKVRPLKSALNAVRNKTAPKTNVDKRNASKFSAKEPQSIVLRRGCLKLSVNFPSDTLVKLQEGNQERVLVQNTCNCKNVTGVTV
jgi:3-mercaptopyruvate sulfurtransferase SseA